MCLPESKNYMCDVKAVFEPFTCKSLSLRNRIVMAPMTRAFATDGVPSTEAARYYARRAQGGVGFIISEAIGIRRSASRNDGRTPLLHGSALEPWRSIVTAVHASGSAIAAQLWHVGALPDAAGAIAPAEPLESPSGKISHDRIGGREMTGAEVADTIAAYASSARDAKEAGFDAVELHGAHGYLIDQFFWKETNARDDSYGGRSIGERSRFAADVIREVRKAVGTAFPILIRLSQWKLQNLSARIANTPEEMEEWLAPMVDAGVDVIHGSQRRFWESEFPGSDLNFAGWAKKITGLPTITVGSVGLDVDLVTSLRERDGASAVPLDALLWRLERGDFDLFSVGRALLADAEWPHKIAAGVKPNPFSKNVLRSLD